MQCTVSWHHPTHNHLLMKSIYSSRIWSPNASGSEGEITFTLNSVTTTQPVNYSRNKAISSSFSLRWRDWACISNNWVNPFRTHAWVCVCFPVNDAQKNSPLNNNTNVTSNVFHLRQMLILLDVIDCCYFWSHMPRDNGNTTEWLKERWPDQKGHPLHRCRCE